MKVLNCLRNQRLHRQQPKDRYKKIQFGEDELFFPNIAEADRKRGVQYAETAYSLEMNSDIYEKINKPAG